MSAAKDNLRKRELALQRLMRQMKFDELQKSQVYRNLEMELQKIQQKEELPEEHPDQNLNWCGRYFRALNAGM